jgi:flagellar FliL protein
MSTAPAKTDGTGTAKASGGRRKFILLVLPVLLGAVGAGLWFSGILPPLLGLGHSAAQAKAAAARAAEIAPPTFIAVPELIANLDGGGEHSIYVKLQAKLELPSEADAATVTADMPRIVDMFQTYLRDLRPEELRGSAGSYRLREELIGRANVAVSPARVTDVLFTQMLIQ